MFDDDNNIGRSRMLPPLPERMRPHNLDGYVGQRHLIGPGCILRNMIESGNLSSFILWGPPGVGKTTLSHIVAKSLGREFYTLSAVSAGVKDVRDVIDTLAEVAEDEGLDESFIDDVLENRLGRMKRKELEKLSVSLEKDMKKAAAALAFEEAARLRDLLVSVKGRLNSED